MAKCRSSTPVRNKEQKIDRLLSFMFLRRRDSSVCPSVSSLVFLLPLPSPPPVPPCSSRRRHISLLLFLPPRRTIRRIEEILLDALWEKNQGVRRKTRKRPRGRKRARSERKGRKGREAREERTRDTCTRKKEQESGSVETGRDCIRRLLQIIQVFWLGIESNYQESDRLHRVAEKGGGGGGCDALTTIFLRFPSFRRGDSTRRSISTTSSSCDLIANL